MLSLTGYIYRKKITVAHTDDGAQTNYQIPITVNRTTGADSGATVYISTKCQADYDDLRFTKSDGITLLDYWIESADANTAIVWIEFDTIQAHPNDSVFYMYYGNATATAVSNGDNTFKLFDDFADNSIDAGKWDTIAEGSVASVVETSGQLQTSHSAVAVNGNAGLLSKSTFALQIAVEIKFSFAGAKPDWGLVNCWGSEYYAGTGYHQSYNKGVNGWYTRKDGLNGTGLQNVAQTLTASTFYRAVLFYGTSIQKAFLNGSLQTSTTDSTYNASSKKIAIGINAGGTTYVTSGIIEFMFVRNKTNTEPAISTWGTEEVSTINKIMGISSGSIKKIAGIARLSVSKVSLKA